MKTNVIGFIFARGGSKGVPRKNIRLLAGKPLIAYAVETALASKLINRVIVSTDDAEIAAVARKYGAEVPFMRPKELAADDSPEWLSWRHAVEALGLIEGAPGSNLFVSIPPTSPLRLPEDIDACVRKLLESNADIVITVTPAKRNPYFNMVTIDKAENARLAIVPEEVIERRQAAPAIFDVTTVAYAARPEFVARAESIFAGRVKAIIIPEARALDIDTEFDFKLAEYFLTHQS